VKPDSEIYIKNVTAPTRTDGSATQFSAVLYDEGGNILNNGKQPMILKEVPGSGFAVTASNQCWNAVTLMADGSYKWRVGASNSGVNTYAAVAYIRVAGMATSSYDDVIITVDEPIVEPTIETVYKWAGTGHFISSEEAITALESRVNVLEDEVEELTVTVDRLKTNSSISMQSGAVWYAFGDSITEGYISYLEEDGTASCKLEPANQHSWVYTVAKLNGYELTNYAVGGTGYAQVKSGASTAREQVDAVDFTGCDLVTFAWGCNDWKYNAGPIGSKDDDKDTATTTCAALKWCIERVLSQNPLCKILVITPINVKRGTFEGNYGVSYEFSNTGSLQDVFDALVSVCESYGIEYIDMTHSSVVNRSNISALLLDTVHPTPEAYAAMGKELARKINFA
jgi:lysophospholipase L1-like esterase